MTMETQATRQVPSPAITAIFSWIIPGGGYWIIGQRAHGVTVGVAVVFVFLMGLLVGGIRVMDPPGWGDYGYMTMIVKREVGADRFELRIVDPMTKDQEENPAADDRDRSWVTALWYQPMAELSDKPWFVGQVLCGPIALGAAWVSVQAARPRGTNAGNADAPMQAAAISHARSWEIGTLYTAVAGMLNLLVMIDAAFRSDQLRTGRA